MPELPEEAFVQALELLVAQDRDWIPDGEGKSLYLRPFMIATQRGLGVNAPSSSYLLCVIASPAASYFGAGQDRSASGYRRTTRGPPPAAPGAVKCGGNYAAAFVAPAAGRREGLRPGRLAGRGRAPVGRGDGRDEHLSSSTGRPDRADRDARADRVAAARHHPRLAAEGAPATRHPGCGRADLGLRVAGRQRLRRAHRGLRLRHRRGDHAGRLGQVGDSGGWTVGTAGRARSPMRLREELLGIQSGHEPDPSAGSTRSRHFLGVGSDRPRPLSLSLRP